MPFRNILVPADGAALSRAIAHTHVPVLEAPEEAEHALRVEWYIVALIAFEILLSLYAMWRTG